MKKAFTLLELLVVIVVIAILLSITFRIMGVGEDQTKRNKTLLRMQGLENAISGYYAAFGSYPPVPLHGSRNIYYPVNQMYIQDLTKKPDRSKLNWYSVRAACLSQPVAVLYPFRQSSFAKVEEIGRQIANSKSNGDVQNEVAKAMAFGAQLDSSKLRNGAEKEKTWSGRKDNYDEILPEWSHVQAFQFGLLSFLLPRYLVMMNGPDDGMYDLEQWGNNNTYPCQFETGVPYESWQDMVKDVRSRDALRRNGKSDTVNENAWRVALLPTQSVTARWIACLEKMLLVRDPNASKFVVYGVDLMDGEDSGNAGLTYSSATVAGRDMKLYSMGATYCNPASLTQTYALDGLQCLDGWGQEFYYYSPPPYQGYVLWSGGPNEKTFPPWITEGEIDTMGAKRVAREWKADDIVYMSH